MNITKQLILPALLVGALGASCKSMHDTDANDIGISSETPAVTPASSPKTGSGTEPAANKPDTSSALASAASSLASMAFPTGDPLTSAILVEKSTPGEIVVGLPFEYEILVTNLTNMPLDNVIVSETMGAGFSLENAMPLPISTEDGVGNWDLGTLSPKEAKSVKIKGLAKDAKMVSTCSTVSYNSGLCVSIPVVEPALTLVASGPEKIMICDDLVYTYTVTNAGTGEARDVVVSGQLPAGLLMPEGGNGFSKRVGTLGAGESRDFILNPKASKVGSYSLTGEAKASGGLTADAEAVKTMVCQPVLEVELKGKDTMFAGRSMKYELCVTNKGDGPAINTMIEQSIPRGMTFKSASERGQVTGGKLRWALGDLAAGETRCIDVQMGTEATGQATTMVAANADCADEATAKLTTELTGIPAILLEVVDLEDPIEIGETETYVITVTNQGSAPGNNIRIDVTIPENCSYVGVNGATKALGAPVGNKLTLTPLRTLAPKETAEWLIQVKGESEADARFRVSMISDELTSTVDESEATNYYE